MNDTRELPTSSQTEVRAYVVRVRAALSDLPEEDVDDLTQGMEADLEELAAESGSIRLRLGTPESYAAELRTAAGLSARTRSAAPAPFEGQFNRLRQRRDTLMARPWVRELRPVGWVLRGAVGAWCLVTMLGAAATRGNPLVWAVGAAASFWLGRHTLAWRGSRRRALTVINVFALLAGLLLMLPREMEGPSSDVQYVQVGTPETGLFNDGNPVTGITVYDSLGRQVDRPRAFDQNGNPILPTPDESTFTPPATMTPLPQSTTPAPAPSSPRASAPATSTPPTSTVSPTPTASKKQ